MLSGNAKRRDDRVATVLLQVCLSAQSSAFTDAAAGAAHAADVSGRSWSSQYAGSNTAVVLSGNTVGGFGGAHISGLEYRYLISYRGINS